MAEAAAANLVLGASKDGVCFSSNREAYFTDLERDLGSLKSEKEELMGLRNHVDSTYQAIQNENPPRLVSYILTAWIDKVDRQDSGLGIVIQEAEEEIRNKRITFCCPKNVCDCTAVGRNVTDKRGNVDKLLKEGWEHAKAVEAIPTTVALHLETGRVVPVEGLRQTDIDAVNTTGPAQL